jgi:hypothetical protein
MRLHGLLFVAWEFTKSTENLVMILEPKLCAPVHKAHVPLQANPEAKGLVAFFTWVEIYTLYDGGDRSVDYRDDLFVVFTLQMGAQLFIAVNHSDTDEAPEYSRDTVRPHMSLQVTVPVTIKLTGFALVWRLLDNTGDVG